MMVAGPHKMASTGCYIATDAVYSGNAGAIALSLLAESVFTSIFAQMLH